MSIYVEWNINNNLYYLIKFNNIFTYISLKIKNMELINRALEFEKRKFVFKTTSDRIRCSKEAKELVLGVNEIYKQNKDPELMDLMKRISVIKQRAEKRLNMRITV